MDVKNALFSILRNQICGEPFDQDLALQLDEQAQKELFKLAHAHDLVHIVANGLLENNVALGEPASAAFRKQQMIAVLRYEKIKSELANICDAFEQAKINYTPLKGSVIRNYYDKPWMRTSCDIDVLVSEDDLEAAKSVLADKLGYEDKGRGTHDIQMESPSGVHIELHFLLTEYHNITAARDILVDYKSHTVQNGYKLEFSDEFLYFYHMDHMAKHFQCGGCGIKPIMDVWVLDNKVPHSDEKRMEMLRVGGLDTFAEQVKHLSAVWFEGKEHNDLTRLMEEYLLSGGVYGNIENYVAINQNKSGGKLAFLYFRIFQNYDQLKNRYPIIQKHKWLTPYAQVRRWCSFLVRGDKKRYAKELQQNANMDQSLSNNTKRLLEELKIVE